MGGKEREDASGFPREDNEIFKKPAARRERRWKTLTQNVDSRALKLNNEAIFHPFLLAPPSPRPLYSLLFCRLS